jgi:uncharacterized membrane-anchored protein
VQGGALRSSSMRSIFNSGWMRRPLRAKVPEVTLAFWALKLLTTGIGESTSDYLGSGSIPLAVLIGAGGVTWALVRQLTVSEYRTWTYWLAVLMVAVFGTMVADAVHRGAGVPYAVSTPLFAIGVGAVFIVWRRSEQTLSIHSITTRRRELFYWSAVLATFALGTAAGDLTALTLHLGFLGSVGLFAAAIALPAVAWARFGLNPVLAFWAAYVVTRPLGASVADWLAKRHALTGLGLGDGLVSAIGLALFASLVAGVALSGRDVQRARHDPAQPLPEPSL